MNIREKSMLIVTLLLIVILIGKSVFFDEVKNLSDEEQQFKEFVEYSISEKYNGKLQQYNIVTYKIFDIFTADDKTKTQIAYLDSETRQKIEAVLDVRYTARVRAYFLGFLPYRQFSVTANPVDNENRGTYE